MNMCNWYTDVRGVAGGEGVRSNWVKEDCFRYFRERGEKTKGNDPSFGDANGALNVVKIG